MQCIVKKKQQDVYAMFDNKYMSEADKECEYEIYKIQEKNHGRIETRTCYVLNEAAFFTNYIYMEKVEKNICSKKKSR